LERGCSCFMPAPDVHGKIQNKLENWWVTLRDSEEKSLGRHVSFLKKVSLSTQRSFDYVFGTHTFALDTFLLSGCISLIAYEWVDTDVDVSSLCWILTLVFLLTLNFFARSADTRRYWRACASVLLLSFGIWRAWTWGHGFVSFFGPDTRFHSPRLIVSMIIEAIIYILLLAISFTCDLVFLHIVRRALRAIISSANAPKMIGLAFLPAIAGLLLCGLPQLADKWGISILGLTNLPSMQAWSREVDAYIWEIGIHLSPAAVAALNFFDLLVGSAFLLVAITLLVHILVWRALEHPIYSLQEVGIARRRKLAAVLGIACLTYGTGMSLALVRRILEAIG
jgi:hypothetical protein